MSSIVRVITNSLGMVVQSLSVVTFPLFWGVLSDGEVLICLSLHNGNARPDNMFPQATVQPQEHFQHLQLHSNHPTIQVYSSHFNYLLLKV
ncbi:hypothetical protein BYT27DRAFT_6767322 [Phlegmacium glaucopus]|nr:hypothetical protein BYT27DRAFT_6767322 [Phlegmacium glaucopus]